MGSIGKYIFRTTGGAFLLVCVSLTLLMWITQALRDIDLMTSQGQNILVFVGITGLIIPLLVMIIAPIAFVVAMAYVLNKLGTDSELIVMNAAGMPPWHIFRPFVVVATLVSLLLVGLASWGSPKALRALREWVTEVRTDLIANVVQPGQFTPLYAGQVTLHIQEHANNGDLIGIFIDDQRDPKERVTVLAEQGQFLKNERGTYLLLARGTIQRQQGTDHDPSIVLFDSYAFDLSQLSGKPTEIRYSSRESYIWELFDSKRDDSGEARAELHDRITAPLYPIAMAVLTFAYLGAPRTTRQGRALSMIGNIAAVALLRALGFLGTLMGAKIPEALAIPYVSLFAACGLGYWSISRGAVIEPPAFVSDAVSALVARFGRE
jgi:lipopolysaccharide export system permease protein